MLSFHIILINGNIEIYGFIFRLQPCHFLLIPGFQPQSLYNLADFPQTQQSPSSSSQTTSSPLLANLPHFNDLLALGCLLLHLEVALGGLELPVLSLLFWFAPPARSVLHTFTVLDSVVMLGGTKFSEGGTHSRKFHCEMEMAAPMNAQTRL